jgi:plasmid stabilization system protein ParE
MLRIELSPAAEIDFDDAVAWYYAHEEGVKIDFIVAVDSTLRFIQASPELFPVAYGSFVRKALAKKFPL